MTVGLIPARGGSKGVPLKNLALLRGYPLIEWTLTSALKAGLDRLIVITDHPEIERAAWDIGASVHEEPAHLAADDVPDSSYVAECLQAERIPQSAIVVLLRPTSPFRRHQDIDAVVQRMLAEDDVGYSIRSVRPLSVSEKAYVRGDDGSLLPVSLDGAANAPRQLARKLWAPTGYIDSVRAFMVAWHGMMDGYRIGAFETPVERCVDLDTPEDFALAERIVAEHGWIPGRVE